jgi:ABC-type sugar transport system permease subunit
VRFVAPVPPQAGSHVPVIDRKPTFLMAPALAWLTCFMVVPCLLVLALAFFRRGLYGGIESTFKELTQKKLIVHRSV